MRYRRSGALVARRAASRQSDAAALRSPASSRSCARWFAFATLLIARFAKNPARTYLRVTLPLFALSLAMPLSSADTAASTKAVLATAHVPAGAIIIPTVARRLRGWRSGRRNPRQPRTAAGGSGWF